MYSLHEGTLGEAAIGSSNNVLCSDQADKTSDALCDQFRVLDHVRHMADDPGYEHLARRKADGFPYAPLMFVARICRLNGVSASVNP